MGIAAHSPWLALNTPALSAIFDTSRGYLLLVRPRRPAPIPEFIQAIYLHVRRPDWSTPLPRVTLTESSITATSFDLRWRANVHHHKIPFAWQGRLTSTREGGFRYEVEGHASAEFFTNRTGLCLLLPQELEGWPAELRLASRPVIKSSFPTLIQRKAPFPPFHSLHFAGGEIQFEGDRFEIEDQRNWGDASFKAYPLVSPAKPYALKAGETFQHAVEFRPSPTPTSREKPAGRIPIRPRFTIPAIHFETGPSPEPPVDTLVGETFSREPSLPKLRFSIHPQVHIFDEALIVRNADSLRPIVRSLLYRAPGRDIHPILTSSPHPTLNIAPEIERIWALLAALAAAEGGASTLTICNPARETRQLLERVFGTQPGTAVLHSSPIPGTGAGREVLIGGERWAINPDPLPAKVEGHALPPFSCLKI